MASQCFQNYLLRVWFLYKPHTECKLSLNTFWFFHSSFCNLFLDLTSKVQIIVPCQCICFAIRKGCFDLFLCFPLKNCKCVFYFNSVLHSGKETILIHLYSKYVDKTNILIHSVPKNCNKNNIIHNGVSKY